MTCKVDTYVKRDIYKTKETHEPNDNPKDTPKEKDMNQENRKLKDSPTDKPK